MALHTLVALNPSEAQKELKRMIEAGQQGGDVAAEQRAAMGFNLADPWFAFVPPAPDEATLKRLG